MAFLLEHYIDKNKALQFFGIWLIIITIIFTIFTAYPNQAEQEVIKTGVEYQKNGEIVYTDWGLGHYFEYFGGKPSQKGGYYGFQDANNAYWLGPDRNCLTIASANTTFFQKC